MVMNQSVNPQPPKHSLCSWVLRFFSFIGSVLTFIRNLIANLVLLLFIIVVVSVYFAISSFKDDAMNLASGNREIPPAVQNAEILYVPLNGFINEMPASSSQLAAIKRNLHASLNGMPERSLSAIEDGLQRAANDSKIKTVLVDFSDMQPLGLESALRIGRALRQLRDSAHKQVLAVGDEYSQGAYAAAANAGTVYLDPLGRIDLKGIGINSLYFNSLLQKLQLTPYVFRAGSFKSAVEPLLRNDMSPEVKAEYQTLADSMWRNYSSEVQDARAVLAGKPLLPPAEVYLDKLKALKGDEAQLQKDLGLVDELKSKNEVLAQLANHYGSSALDKLKPYCISLDDYLSVAPATVIQSSSRIAVVYGVGTIVDQPRDGEDFAPGNIIPLLDRIRRDDSIKALVFYINSSGGSAAASEQIRRALLEVKSAGKKVVVSFQDIGASGAYMIASAADKIMAAPGALTGSIGVFMATIGASQLLNNYGVTQDGVSTHTFAANSLAPLAEPLNPEQAARLQLSVDNTYRHFIDITANGRKLNPDDYLNFAEGRVFNADQALQHQLIDAKGSFKDAVALAEKLCKLKEGEAELVNILPQSDPGLGLMGSLLTSAAASMLPPEITQALLDLRAKELLSTKPEIVSLSLIQAPKL